MNKEEILIAIKEIQCRYCLPALEKNFTDKDYAIQQFEKLVIHLANQQEKKDKEIERLNNKIKRIAYQCYKSDMSYDEFKQIWVNAMGKIYEPIQIDELEKELGDDKE